MKPGMTADGARWAFALMQREASGEQLPSVSTAAWREVLGFGKDVTAKHAMEQTERKAA